MTDLLVECGALLERVLGGDLAARAELLSRRDALEALARRGETKAQTLLGRIAVSVSGEDDDAALWLAFAAEADDPVALRLLGSLHENGRGVAQDLVEAVALYERAAELGDALALFALGTLYLDGRGAPSDLERARTYLERSVETDDYPHAWERLAIVHARRGDHAAARAATRRAAAGGIASAMKRLGDEARSAGALVDAAHWYFRMLTAGSGDGIHEVLSFAREMSDEEIRSAATLAGRPSLAETAIETVRKRPRR